MAGGRSDFTYTTDAGVTYAINMDTSNANVATNTPAGNGTDFLPRNIKPRFAVYKDQTGIRTRVIPVSTAAKLAAMPLTFDGGDESGTVTFTLQYTRGEKARRSRSVNTGIIP